MSPRTRVKHQTSAGLATSHARSDADVERGSGHTGGRLTFVVIYSEPFGVDAVGAIDHERITRLDGKEKGVNVISSSQVINSMSTQSSLVTYALRDRRGPRTKQTENGIMKQRGDDLQSSEELGLSSIWGQPSHSGV